MAFAIDVVLVLAVAPLRFDWFLRFEAVLGVVTGCALNPILEDAEPLGVAMAACRILRC